MVRMWRRRRRLYRSPASTRSCSRNEDAGARKRSANDTVTSQKTTLLPDGTGNWQVSETGKLLPGKKAKRAHGGAGLPPDGEGKLAEVSHTVSKESENAPVKSAITWRLIPRCTGLARDGSLHLV